MDELYEQANIYNYIHELQGGNKKTGPAESPIAAVADQLVNLAPPAQFVAGLEKKTPRNLQRTKDAALAKYEKVLAKIAQEFHDIPPWLPLLGTPFCERYGFVACSPQGR